MVAGLWFYLLFSGELVFAEAAEWAYPVFWQIFESSTRSYAVIFIANSWIVNITASITYISLHNKVPHFQICVI